MLRTSNGMHVAFCSDVLPPRVVAFLGGLRPEFLPNQPHSPVLRIYEQCLATTRREVIDIRIYDVTTFLTHLEYDVSSLGMWITHDTCTSTAHVCLVALSVCCSACKKPMDGNTHTAQRQIIRGQHLQLAM
jgi:hypothetical protein